MSPNLSHSPALQASRTSTAELDRTLTLPLSADASPPVSSDDEDSDFKPRVRSLCSHLAMEADNTAVLIAGFPHKRREAIIASLVDAGTWAATVPILLQRLEKGGQEARYKGGRRQTSDVPAIVSLLHLQA